MPSSPAWPFKVAVEAALRGSSALLTAMGQIRLYTEAPTNAVIPFIEIGADQVIPDYEGCVPEAEIISTIHLWSRAIPSDKGEQARAMGAAVIAALVPLGFPGWDVDAAYVQSEDYSTSADQSTHGIITLRFLVTEQVAP